MVKSPLVSVLLPVYNAASYVQEAIESILSQTYQKFELIVINDGSTDGSGQIIKAIHDPRIRVIDQPNRGLSNALNRAIEAAQGDYLARQDADDIALPQRFERQVDFLEGHLNVAIVGTWAEVRSDKPTTEKIYAPPTDSSVLKFELLFDNPFVHSSMMLRSQALHHVRGYTEDRAVRAEDYDLWSRVAREYEVGNIPETLQIYRDTPNSKLKNERTAVLDNVTTISITNLEWITKRDQGDLAINDLSALLHGAYHRVRGHSTLNELTALLFEAADTLSHGGIGQVELLQEKVRAQCKAVCYHYELYSRYHKGGKLRRKVIRLAEMIMQATPFHRNSDGRDL